MPNKALLFDADGTLFDFPASERHALHRLFSSLSIPYDRETDRVYQEANALCWKEYEAGLITVPILKEKRFALFFSAIGLDADSHEAGEAYAAYLGEKAELLPGARELLDALRPAHPLYIITNGFESTQRSRIRSTGLDGYFQDIFISESAGASKPARAFFDYVFRRIPFKPSETLVIGDSETSDMRGALDYGIESIYLSFEGRTSAIAGHSVSSYHELLSLLHDIDQRDIEDQV